MYNSNSEQVPPENMYLLLFSGLGLITVPNLPILPPPPEITGYSRCLLTDCKYLVKWWAGYVAVCIRSFVKQQWQTLKLSQHQAEPPSLDKGPMWLWTSWGSTLGSPGLPWKVIRGVGCCSLLKGCLWEAFSFKEKVWVATCWGKPCSWPRWENNKENEKRRNLYSFSCIF